MSEPTKKAMVEAADMACAIAQMLLTAAREELPVLAGNPMVLGGAQPRLLLLISSVAGTSDAEVWGAVQRWSEYLKAPAEVAEPSMAGTPHEYRQVSVTTIVGGLPVVIWGSVSAAFCQPDSTVPAGPEVAR